jgi:hypothetical protein
MKFPTVLASVFLLSCAEPVKPPATSTAAPTLNRMGRSLNSAQGSIGQAKRGVTDIDNSVKAMISPTPTPTPTPRK